MRRLGFSLGVALLVLASATASHANIFVKISDGATTVDASRGVLVLTKSSQAPTGTTDVTDILNVLTCAVRPCTAFFPSGAATQQAGDTFKIQDVSSTALARVEKFDSVASADRVSFKGVKVTSLVAGRVLTITYGVQPGDLRALTATSSSYTGTAALTGTFKTSTGLRAAACNAGLTSTDVATSCVKLSVALNGTTVNGAGATAVATVAVPCNNSFPDVNPCGTNGSYVSSLGSFTGVNDSKSISCPATCTPTQVGTVTATFGGANEVLQLTASANGAMSSVPDEQGGLEGIYLALADELGTNRWIAYTAASERCRAVPKAPTTNDTRNVTNNSNLPISFEFWCGFFAPLVPPAGVDLVSIVDPAELANGIVGGAATRNDAARVGFLPAPGALALKGINVLSLSYDVVVDPSSPSGNTTLGNLAFTDCKAGSLRVELELLDSKGAAAGTAKVYLGSNADDHFKSDCNGFESIGTDLVNNPDARVDTSGLGSLASACCVTFKTLQQGQLGKLLVRRISLVVDHGEEALTVFNNHKVVFRDGSVNGITALSSLQVVTGLQRTSDLSTNGVSITITKLTSPSNSSFVPTVVKVIRSGSIVINGGKFTTSVNINDLAPESGAQYTISLCPNGVEEGTYPANTPVGLCIGDQAFMTLL